MHMICDFSSHLSDDEPTIFHTHKVERDEAASASWHTLNNPNESDGERGLPGAERVSWKHGLKNSHQNTVVHVQSPWRTKRVGSLADAETHHVSVSLGPSDIGGKYERYERARR